MTASTVSHLIPYSTFLPFVASVFEEAAPSKNLFLVYGSGDSSLLPAHLSIETVGIEPSDLNRVGRAIVGSRAVIVHSMSTFSAQALAAAPPSTLRVWSGWGGEYYGSMLNPTAGLLGRTTARRQRQQSSLVERAMQAYSSRYVDSLFRAAARAADVFSAPVPTDFAVFRRRFRGFRGRYSQLNYASVEDTYATLPDRAYGNDILVGNSATPENNHLETLSLLAQLDLGERRVVVPLGYGDSTYADDVVQAGSELFGDRFVPMREFLPLAEYNDLVAGCGVVVMGHRRQQALGNVARAIWQGAHVYLDRRSPILEYFRAVELQAQTLDELRVTGLPASAKSDHEVAAARQTAKTLWSRDVVINNIRAVLAEASIHT